jgi:hypothetical protein
MPKGNRAAGKLIRRSKDNVNVDCEYDIGVLTTSVDFMMSSVELS